MSAGSNLSPSYTKGRPKAASTLTSLNTCNYCVSFASCSAHSTPLDLHDICPQILSLYGHLHLGLTGTGWDCITARFTRHVTRMGKIKRVLVEEPQGKTSLEKPNSRWRNHIRIDLKEIGLGCVDWIDLAHDGKKWRDLVNDPSGFIESGNFSRSWITGSFSG